MNWSAGQDVVCNDLTEFAKLVAERAQRVHEVGQPASAAGPQWLALIKADKPDNVVADEVSEALTSANVNCRVTRTGKTGMDWLTGSALRRGIDRLRLLFGRMVGAARRRVDGGRFESEGLGTGAGLSTSARTRSSCPTAARACSKSNIAIRRVGNS